MWPFKKNEDYNEALRQAENKRTEQVAKDVNELKDFREVGGKFNYIGLEMTVTGHIAYIGFAYTIPQLNCIYLNSGKEITIISFSLSDLELLRSENTLSPI